MAESAATLTGITSRREDLPLERPSAWRRKLPRI